MPEVTREHLRKLLELFPNKSISWARRCAKRINDVKRSGHGLWFVRGREELGDWHALYIVRRENNRYVCSCGDAFRLWGSKRKRDVCSHIGAVVLYEIVHGGSLDDA